MDLLQAAEKPSHGNATNVEIGKKPILSTSLSNEKEMILRNGGKL